MTVSAEILNMVLTAMGIITSIVIALLAAIWSEIRLARKDVSSHSVKLGMIETTVRLLPCKVGGCALEGNNERVDE